MAKLKESENKLQQRVEEFTRRENVLNMRLATKQQELQELVVSGAERSCSINSWMPYKCFFQGF